MPHDDVGVKTGPDEQPLPVEGSGPNASLHAVLRLFRLYGQHPEVADVLGLIEKDMVARMALGIKRYGKVLQPFNGRDFYRDLYEELLDGLAYGEGLRWELRHPNRDELELVDTGESDTLDYHMQHLYMFVVWLRQQRFKKDGK